ncbi:response regulator [Flammeovirga sp. MY04]|uniref:response regulator n=1 Tax=Flammeovirga sp. MY04 TaxID=1191459 RepID=UPI0008063F03|nr:response regulator [Flammeovirga sp. MY04]ANQ49229.1 response regulator [Flammeovirga sp. MY04]
MKEKKLIFIDDDELLIDIVKIISSTLNETKHLSKSYYRSGDEFLKNTLINDYTSTDNYVFLDLNMPGLDGWQVLEELMAFNFSKELKIYILSSSIHPRDKERAEANPLVHGYIEKPLSKQKLLDCITKNKVEV